MLGSFKADKCWAVLVPLCFDLPTGYLRNHPFTIGRHLQCDLVIAELQVSRKHASISFKTYNRGSEFVIVCHSKNCLFLNQQRVADSKSRMLNDGDEIWLSKGREGPRHRPIGFLFRVGDADTETTLFTKYEGELNLLQKFVTTVKGSLICSRCSKFMKIPINSNPCCHKLCQQCAKAQAELGEDICKTCKQPILSFFYDSRLASVTEAYLRYKSVSQYSPTPTNYTDFCHEPFIFRPDSETNSISKQTEINSEVKETTEAKPKRRRVKWQDQLKEHDSGEAKETLKRPGRQRNRKGFNRTEQFPSSIQQVSISLPLKQDPSSLPKQPSLSFFQEAEREAMDFQTAEVPQFLDLSNPPESVPCFSCGKKFLFSSKNMNLKHCIICHRFYCNLEYPPCSNGEEPLLVFRDRIKGLSPQGLSLLLQERFKLSISRILLRHLQKDEAPFIFWYVLMREGGTFLYQHKLTAAAINGSSSICNLCWPLLTTDIIITFLKYHKEHITTFDRRLIQKALAEAADYLKRRTSQSRVRPESHVFPLAVEEKEL